MFETLKGHGVVKANVGTKLRRIWWKALDEGHGKKPREVVVDARRRVCHRATEIIRILRY